MNRQVSEKNKNIIMAWAGAALWAAGLFLLSSLSPASEEAMSASAVRLVEWAASLLFGGPFSHSTQAVVMELFRAALQMLGFGVLALMIWNALRIMGVLDHQAMVLGAAGAVLYAVTDELHQVFVPGRGPRVIDWALDCLGALLAIALLLACRWARRKFPRLFNRETVSYVVFGVLTTLVNMAVYGLCYNVLRIHNLISNALAWVAAVLFAYVVNKLFVFHSHTRTARALVREFGLFIAARLFSFGVDELGMGLLVNLLHVNGGVSKVLTNIVVMVMNYFFSKWIIFKRDESPERPAE